MKLEERSAGANMLPNTRHVEFFFFHHDIDIVFVCTHTERERREMRNPVGVKKTKISNDWSREVWIRGLVVVWCVDYISFFKF